ncbi:MAG: hexitol phosphatase HxpB [Bacteroidetes bacterium]|nr:hexitol phosphatase HxpB [Bacteroidota bacterium]
MINLYKAIIFDMDGVIINSEPFWKMAEFEVFGEIGVTLKHEDIEKNVGLKNTEVVNNICLQFNIQNPSQEEICRRLEQNVVDLIYAHGEEIEGLSDLLQRIKSLGIPMAIATSSSHKIIQAVFDKLQLNEFFTCVSSAYDEEYGKPHPAVYLTTAKTLKIDPRYCLVIEDSINGVLAGKAAKMTVIAMPEEANFNHPKYAIADFKSRNFKEIRALLFEE